MSPVFPCTIPLLAEGSASILTYLGNSNTAGKFIILILAVASMIAWTIMMAKHVEIRKMRLLNFRLERLLDSQSELFAMDLSRLRAHHAPYAILLREAIDAHQRAAGVPGTTLRGRIGQVENALQRSVNKLCGEYESKMIMLASIVTLAPFLGLLGTVWGVMDAFGAVALQSTATIQALAPGVSGALLTTVAGLLVAIPSVFGYKYLLNQTKVMIADLENFASSLADRLELEDRESGGTHLDDGPGLGLD